MPAALHLAGGTRTDVAQPITVQIAEAQASVRRSLRMLLDGPEWVRVVGETANADSMMRALRQHSPDVLLLDLRLPGGSGLELIRQARTLAPDTEVVLLTMQNSAVFARRASDAGALGYVLKDRAEQELLDAIRAAAHGEEFVTPSVAAAVAGLKRSPGGRDLTERETEVLRLVALGYTGTEIAELLHRSRRTVEAHRARVYSKLSLSTRAELVRYALTHSLIGLPPGP